MGNRRFEMHDLRKVLVRMRQGETDRQIARGGFVGRAKASEIRKIAADQGWLDVAVKLPKNDELAKLFRPSRVREQAVSTVTQFHEQIEKWRTDGIQGTTIHNALDRKYGYSGSYSSVRRYLQRLNKLNPEVTIMLDFHPGEAAQVDFGKGGEFVDVKTGEIVSGWFFVMTLAWSRYQYAELVRDQKIETWLGCHRRAFEFFGGVPGRVLIDNPKCAITRACYHDPVVQRSYEDFAEEYGLKIDPCPVRDPKKKGRVESGVKYVKNNFMPLRDFRSLADANKQLKTWVLETAGTRIHGTTKRQPIAMFNEIEQNVLSALPDVPPELVWWKKHKLHGNCHIEFEKSFYSAPYALVSQELWVRVTETTVQIFKDHELVAIHPHLKRPGSRSTIKGHLPPDSIAYLMRDPTWCRLEGKRVGPWCAGLIEQLFSHRVLYNLRAAQSVIGLEKKYGPERLEKACHRAVKFGTPKYGTVKTILERGLDRSLHLFVTEESMNKDLNPVYTGSGKFCRDSKTLLH